jgi:undecaprenyl-diphosphatase
MMTALLEIIRGIIEQYGYAGIFVLTAMEQFIIPVPADIFVAMATSMGLPFKEVLGIVLVGALVGSYIGYFIGRYFGHPVLRWLFREKPLMKAEAFIEKWGVWGIIIAGLTPIPFKLVTITAGALEMSLGHFTLGVFFGRMPRYLITAYAGALLYQSKFYATSEMTAILLGALQGVTEFLPISSSGHLAVMEHFLKLPEAVQAMDLEFFDILLHGGSLLAIVIYFWRDWVEVLKEFWHMITRWKWTNDALVSKLIIGTIPAIIAGLLFGSAIGEGLRGLMTIAIFFILIGIYYLFAEWKSKGNHAEHISLKKALIIGSAQALALLPGVSRAGSTIATGMLLGIRREVAAKFSFMLGGVAILAANVYTFASLTKGAVLPDLQFTLIGVVTSFLVSLVAIHWLLKFLQHHTLRPFAAYLIVMGTLILVLF